ncbi:HAD family hydrolase [Demequina muriae]|uniref:HAD family phosphatase n=1 Tax=Demequina muriae TaxID=3051664 RepID=A0ABT8GD33_9MICO|nr:HAD family phosphatase [Demequina sp. EGI L300058]MDN4479348.1 HAD family phosphatase [Demequina sp. EGI L300058]
MNAHTPAPAAILWDMDGTLIDSEPYWIAAETALAERFGVTWTHEDGLSLVGRPLVDSGRILQERGVALDVEEIIASMVATVADRVRAHVPWQADARLLLERVVAAGIPCALVTMSYTRLADAFLAQVPDAFAVVVTGDEVERGKPDPESYLTAAARLGVDPTRCVAIEDSPAGIGSALASGAHTIGVRRLVPVEPRPGLSRVRSLENVTVETLGEIAAGRRLDDLGLDDLGFDDLGPDGQGSAGV